MCSLGISVGELRALGSFLSTSQMPTFYSHPESWEQASREERTQDLLCCSLSLLRRSIHGVQLACEVYDGIIPAWRHAFRHCKTGYFESANNSCLLSTKAVTTMTCSILPLAFAGESSVLYIVPLRKALTHCEVSQSQCVQSSSA